ncbi:hypothetical protein J6590_037346 [Homalodisca vitripennis]|nr:hypothetical protein J6590_037346 [Homalodisca vitripennis]
MSQIASTTFVSYHSRPHHVDSTHIARLHAKPGTQHKLYHSPRVMESKYLPAHKHLRHKQNQYLWPICLAKCHINPSEGRRKPVSRSAVPAVRI